MADWPYNTRRWQQVRRNQLSRSPLCVLCERSGDITPAREVDHKVRIKAGGAVWDKSNLQSLCSPCHSRKTQYEERGVEPPVIGCDAEGNPADPNHRWNKSATMPASPPTTLERNRKRRNIPSKPDVLRPPHREIV